MATSAAILGLSMYSDHFYWAVLGGTLQSPSLLAKHREPTPTNMDDGVLMDWFATKFGNLIAEHQPSSAAFRLLLPSSGRSCTRDQMVRSLYPNAIFMLVCERSHDRILVGARTAQSLTLHALGLSDGRRDFDAVSDYCDQVFGHPGPYWDKGQKEAIVVAWLGLA